MRRRSRAGGEPIKTRRRKAATLKRRNAPKALHGRGPSISELQEQLEHRTRELHEALEQPKATAAILHLVSGLHIDLARVFDAIVANATRICDASFGNLALHESD